MAPHPAGIARHLDHGVDLVVERTLDGDEVLPLAPIELDGLAGPLEQVDGGRDEQGEIVGVDPGLERRLRVLEEDDKVDLRARAAADRRREILELDEQEALREREVLPQQPIANEGLARARQERLAVGETTRPHRAPPDDMLPGGAVPLGLAHDADGMAKQRLVQPKGDDGFGPAGAGPGDRATRLRRELAGGLQADLQRRLDFRPARQVADRERGAGEVAHLRDFDRPQT